jgi:hypothetical protein
LVVIISVIEDDIRTLVHHNLPCQSEWIDLCSNLLCLGCHHLDQTVLHSVIVGIEMWVFFDVLLVLSEVVVTISATPSNLDGNLCIRTALVHLADHLRHILSRA